MNRRQFLEALGIASLGLAFGPPTGRAAKSKPLRRPNILLLFPDQWRRQALGCYGDPVVRTPNLDRLGREGVIFDRCYTTNPVCTPARASLLTGRYPHQTGLIRNNLRLPAQEVTLAECLRQAGYVTGYIGKWHLDGEAKPGFVPPGERRQGFDYFEGFNRGHWYHNARYFTNDGTLVRPEVFESFYQTDLALRFMERHRDRPFFLFLAWGPPHMPYRPPKEFDRFRPEDLQWRSNVPEEMRRDPRTIRELCGYYGLCETLDHEVGRLLKFLEEQGLAENTLVLFTADHGDCHGSHGLRYKGHPVEESLGIPLLLRWPEGIPAGRRSKTLIALIDLMPSLLSLCGLPVPEEVGGCDLSAALQGEEVAVEALYTEGRMQHLRVVPPGRGGVTGARYGAWRAVVTPRYKLAVDFTGRVRLLTDLQEDPYELHNLADRPEHAALQQDLLALLREWGRKSGDPFPKPVSPASGA
ncbi:MAG TPA: DUF229 domain-containing protein [Armatimonadetes bacterium]|nr:DUF229 domain-containing protein [Armatimonadota bacterium]